jgi:nucleoside-diphosphate-sugar epimerase
MLTHTILGAGGSIARGLTKLLIDHKENLRLVSRNPSLVEGAEVYPADVSDPREAVDAIKGSDIVYLCVGLKYDFAIWRVQWPRIMNNVIDACKKTGAKLIFFDNVYMYGKVEGPMTEETPYDPSSKKGDLRARIATQLMSEVRKDNISAMIARSADFYGPGADKTSVPNMLVFANLAKGKRAQWLANAHVKHSFTYTPDACKALYTLAKNDQSWNQVWHLPTASNPLTGKEFIETAAAAFGRPANYMLLRPWLMKVAGLFNKDIAESVEMLYQSKYEYLFDSTKFEKAFGIPPTPYRDGIYETAAYYKKGE